MELWLAVKKKSKRSSYRIFLKQLNEYGYDQLQDSLCSNTIVLREKYPLLFRKDNGTNAKFSNEFKRIEIRIENQRQSQTYLYAEFIQKRKERKEISYADGKWSAERKRCCWNNNKEAKEVRGVRKMWSRPQDDTRGIERRDSKRMHRWNLHLLSAKSLIFKVFIEVHRLQFGCSSNSAPICPHSQEIRILRMILVRKIFTF